MDNTYTVHASLHPDQPNLIQWLFEEVDEAKSFYETLQHGKTARAIVLELKGPDGESIERVRLGNHLPAKPWGSWEYSRIIEPLDHSTMTTGHPDDLLID